MSGNAFIASKMTMLLTTCDKKTLMKIVFMQNCENSREIKCEHL